MNRPLPLNKKVIKHSKKAGTASFTSIKAYIKCFLGLKKTTRLRIPPKTREKDSFDLNRLQRS
jgi:hypothetical protein